MSAPLTITEAVPLATVHLQRLLNRAGVRSLVIKGPAFVQLGARNPRTSNDVDLLIHPNDRARTARVLGLANWESISYRLPEALDDFAYSTTYRHALFPASVDVHHAFLGMLEWPAGFEELWRRRCSVEIAHVSVIAPSREDALIIEALNALKSKTPKDWPQTAERVLAGAGQVDVGRLENAATSLGARETVAPLIAASGGPQVHAPSTPAYLRWVSEAGQDRRRLLLYHVTRRTPWALPGFVRQQVTLSQERAQYWAHAHGVTFHSKCQIFLLRLKKLLFG